MLTPAQRTFIAVEQIILPFVFNLVFNAALGWYLFRTHVPVPLWGDPSIGADILGMLFFLPFFTCLVGTPLINRATRLGKVDKLTIRPEQHWLLRHLPRSLWVRSILIGAACTVALGPLSIGLLALLDMYSWSLMAAINFKGVYAGILAAVVTPPIALYALSQHEAPSDEAA
jgi:hypothetical protein